MTFANNSTASARTATIEIAGPPVVLTQAGASGAINATLPQLRLSQVLPPSSRVQLSFATAVGRNYSILSSSNLNSPGWQLLTNTVSTSTNLQIVDPIGLPARFYRAVSP